MAYKVLVWITVDADHHLEAEDLVRQELDQAIVLGAPIQEYDLNGSAEFVGTPVPDAS